MSNWIPEGSVPYATATARGDIRQRHIAHLEGSVPYQGTVPYKGEKARDPKLCIGNGNTCKGFKTKGSELCAGHLKAKEKREAERLAAVAALTAEGKMDDGGEDQG